MLVKIISCLLFFAVLVKSDEKDDKQIIDEIMSDVLKNVGKKNEIVKFQNGKLADIGDIEGAWTDTVYVEAQMGDGSHKNLSFIFDGYDKDSYNEFNESNDFRKELRQFTNDVAPHLEELAEEMNDFSENIFVKVITIKKHVAVKEDVMRYGNYTQMIPYGQDLKHSILAIVTLAKVHAMTAVLNERGKLTFKSDKEMFDMNHLEQTKTPEGLAMAGKSLIDSMVLAWGEGWNEAAERLKTKLGMASELIIELIKSKDDFPLTVLNLFEFERGYFKYGVSDVYTSKDPIAMKMNNHFKVSFIGSPIFDINFFMATVPNVTVMFDYQDHLLKKYHDALTRYLKQYQYKKDIPSLGRFQSEINKTKVFKLFASMSGLPYSYYCECDQADIQKYKAETAKMNKKILSREEGYYGKRYIETMKQLLRKAMADNVI